MTALRKENRASENIALNNVYSGLGTSLFSSGSISTLSSSEFDGVSTELFSSGSAPQYRARAHNGEAVMLFSSGS